MSVTLQTIADSVLIEPELPTNFAVHGRRSSYGHTGLRASGNSIRPFFPQTGEIYNDWSWKPSASERSSIARGNAKCAPPAFDQYLATLSSEERQRVLTAKHQYESHYFTKLEPLERTFAEQMDGWKEGGRYRDALGAVSLTSSRI